MARWCVDASAVLASVLSEHATAAARAFWSDLTGFDDVVGPQLLLPECTSVLRQRVGSGELTEAESADLLEDLLSLPIRIHESRDQFRVALTLAGRLKRPKAYDMQYLAVATIERAELVTLDRGLRQAATDIHHPVRLLR